MFEHERPSREYHVGSPGIPERSWEVQRSRSTHYSRLSIGPASCGWLDGRTYILPARGLGHNGKRTGQTPDERYVEEMVLFAQRSFAGVGGESARISK